MAIDRSVLPPLGEPTSLEFPEIVRETLPGGVQLRTVDYRQQSLVSLILLLRSGSAADPVGREGLAGLTAALIDEGSERYSALALHEALGDVGGRLGIDVFSDATVLSITALARYTDHALKLLLDVAMAPRFEAHDFNRVRALRINRILQLRQSAGAVADRLFLRALYGQHPYGHAAIGTENSLTAISVEDLHAFHATHYARTNWTVVAVGSGNGSDLRSIVEEGISRLVPSPVVTRPSHPTSPFADPLPPPNRLVFVAREGAVQSELRIGSLGVARRINGYEALTVLDMVLGGQFSSRLNLNLREAKGYTYGVRSSFEARCGRGPFVVRTAVDAEVTVDAVHEVVREISEIRGLRPVTDDEVMAARSALTRGFPRSFETAGQVARAAMRLAVFELPDDEYTTFVPRIAGVDRDAVTAAAREHLDPDGLIVVVVGPPAVRASLADLGFGEPFDTTSE